MYNFRVFHRSSKAGMVALVVKPWEVITTQASIYMNMLGIVFESYGHVLGPPKFLFISEKKKFIRFLSHFLMV